MSTKDQGLPMNSFSAENRKKYISETTQSLDTLLDDAFGEDLNDLRSLFPDKCERKKIKSETRISLTYTDGNEEGFIEVLIQISYAENEIGEYQSIYNLDGVLEDESFFFE